VGRPYEQIEKTSLSTFHLTRDGRGGTQTGAAALEQLAALAERGIDHAIIGLRNVHEAEPFEVLAKEVVPAAERMRVAGR
jgi:hypothetical protein